MSELKAFTAVRSRARGPRRVTAAIADRSPAWLGALNPRRFRPRQSLALLGLCLLGAGSLPCRAAPPVPAGPSPELMAAFRVVERLMAASSFGAPIRLVVRPFPGSPCPDPQAPADQRRVAASAPGPGPGPAVCLSGFELPPRLREGFFVPFVVALQHQSVPDSDPQRRSAAIAERTILLNAALLTRTDLALPSQTGAPATQRAPAPRFVLPAEATCRLAQEFAAVASGQPQRQQQRFEEIHNRLAARIHRVAVLAHRGHTLEEVLDLPVQTLMRTYYVLPWIGALQARQQGRWVNARLRESPHWQVLERQAPAVAQALRDLGDLPDSGADLAQLQRYGPRVFSVRQAWGLFDGWFGVAAQEREALLEAERRQSQAEAMALMARAGIDPRACASVFVGVSGPDQAVLRTYEATRRQTPVAGPLLPHRFLPAEQTVEIEPLPPRAVGGQPGAGAPVGPPDKGS